MEGRLWRIVLDHLPPPGTGPHGCQFDDRTIVMLVVWSVLHDRPFGWSCLRESWPESIRPRNLPDPSTLCRRRRLPAIAGLLKDMMDSIGSRFAECRADAAVDSRPVLVGGATKDPQAASGRGAGGFARGYRAHMLVDRAGVVRVLRLCPINVSEKVVARELIHAAPAQVRRIVGDGNYDSMVLHGCAAEAGMRLYTPLRQNRVGKRRQKPRLRLLRLWSTPVGKRALKARDGIERVFGRMSGFACGLKPIPPWVRGVERVTQWVTAKIAIYHAYLVMKSG